MRFDGLASRGCPVGDTAEEAEHKPPINLRRPLLTALANSSADRGPFAAAADDLAARATVAAAPDVAAAAGGGARRLFQESIGRLLGPHLRLELASWQLSAHGARDPHPLPQAFLDHLSVAGWADIFARTPGLAPLAESVLSLEIAAVAQVLAYIAADRPWIERWRGRPLAPVTGIAFGLSDPHDGHRRVARLSFGDGAVLFYKPRGLAADAALSRLSDWMRELDCPLTPQFPASLDCGTHGWSEAVEAEACVDPAAAFRRLGALAAVMGALGAVDCHGENIVMGGSGPVLVDAEAVLHPRIGASPGFTIQETEIFPRLVIGPGGQEIRYPGFDGAQADPGRPRLADHLAEARAGAAAAAQFLAAHSETFRERVRELLPARARTRVILRPTGMYAAVLDASLSPAALNTPGGRDAVFARLRAYDDPLLTREAWDAIHAYEREALLRADIPRILGDVRTGELYASDGRPLAPARLRPFLDGLDAGFAAYLDTCRTAC